MYQKMPSKKMDWPEKEINMDGTHLIHLRFADDIVIFSNDQQELKVMIYELQKVDLRMNNKTKIMRIKIDMNIILEETKLSIVPYIWVNKLKK